MLFTVLVTLSGCAPAETLPASWRAPVSMVLNVPDGSAMHAVWVEDGRTARLQLDEQLLNLVTSAQSVHVLELLHGGDGTDSVAALVVQSPSKAGTATQRCGAGTEDWMVVVARAEGQLVILDSILLQSCLETIEILNDTDDRLPALLRPLPPPALVSFTWIRPPDFEPVNYVITFDGGRLRAAASVR